MNQPSSSMSLDLDKFSNSSDSLSECETLTVPDPNDPVTIRKFVDETVIGPISLQEQNIDHISAINTELHIGTVHKNIFHFHGNIKPPSQTNGETRQNGTEETRHLSGQVGALPAESPPQNVFKRIKFFLMERSMIFWLAGLILAILSITSLTVFFCFYPFPSKETSLSVFEHSDNLGNGIQVIHRKEWGARAPLANATKINHPLKMVRIMHTGGTNCSDYQTCAKKVLALQGWQVGTQNMDDISYNFLIGGDANVYEGRGAGVENQWKKDAIDVVYIGNYLTPYDKVTDKMDEAGRMLLKKLEDEGYLTSDYVVVAQNQTHNTQSPGENVFSRVIKWPHYDSGLYFKN